MIYLEQLIDRANIALKAEPEFEFKFSSLDKLNHVESSIYIIREIGGSPEETFSAMSKFKKSNERSCPRLNSASPVMYVGSSTTNLRYRIRQHLGHGSAKTYALHLNKWFEGEFSITIRRYNVTRPVLQLIEDGISYNLKPAFGKSGANNKY